MGAFLVTSAGCVDEPAGFDSAPADGSRSDTADGESAAATQSRSPQGGLRSKSAIPVLNRLALCAFLVTSAGRMDEPAGFDTADGESAAGYFLVRR
jgi:hypothetical protein